MFDGKPKIMKRTTILLVLLNIVIFAYFQWPDATSSNAHQVLPELHPEKVQLLSDQQVQELPTVSAPSSAE